jgi:hypothetical protein
MSASRENFDGLPSIPLDGYSQQRLVLQGVREEHAERLRGLGLIEKARYAMPEHQRKSLEGAVAEPVVYRRPQIVLTDTGYVADPNKIESGVCFIVTSINHEGRTQQQLIHFPIAYAEDGFVFPRYSPDVYFTGQEAREVYEMGESLHAARQQGTLSLLKPDCTDLHAGNSYEG